MSKIAKGPFVLKSSDNFGRCLVARKHLPAGRLVFQEEPIFLFSKLEDDISEDVFKCISCYKVVMNEDGVNCQRCHWPLCERCSKKKSHGEGECEVLRRNAVLPSPKTYQYMYLIRVMELKRKDRNRWDRVMSLASTLPVDTQDYIDHVNELSAKAKRFLERTCKIYVSLEEIKKIVYIFRINSFGFEHESQIEGEPGTSYRALYSTCCLLAHSCSPNAEWYLVGHGRKQGTMGIFTRKDISAGELVTVPYTEDFMREGVVQRQILMFNRFSFYCACTRCMDPTDLNTMSSALKCPSCQDGWLLPPPSLSKENCSTCHTCDTVMMAINVERIENIFRKKLVALHEKRTLWKKRYQEKKLDDLIENATSRYNLHPRHNLVIVAVQRWLDLQSFDILLKTTPLSKLVFEKIIERAERTLFIALSFSSISLRVESEAIISRALIRFHFKSKDYVKIGKDVTNLSDKIRIIHLILMHLQAGIPVLRHTTRFDNATKENIWSMEKKLSVWESRIRCCISQFLQEN